MINYSTHEFLQLGPLYVGISGVMFLSAFFVYANLVIPELSKRKLLKGSKNIILMLSLLIGLSILGGRLWYAIFDGRGWQHWYDFFLPQIGGWVSWGVLLGGIIGLVIYILIDGSKSKQQRFGQYADVLALYLPIWIVIYRIGCFFHGCCFGKETYVPWSLHVVETGKNIHPTQIYCIINALIIFCILWIFFRREKTKNSWIGKRFDGETALWFLLLYSIGRFIIDFLRWYPSSEYWHGLVVSQWVCMILFMIALYALVDNYLFLHFADQKLIDNVYKKNKYPLSLFIFYIRNKK